MGDILVAIFADTWPDEHLGAEIQQNLAPGQTCICLEDSLGPNACRDSGLLLLLLLSRFSHVQLCATP